MLVRLLVEVDMFSVFPITEKKNTISFDIKCHDSYHLMEISISFTKQNKLRRFKHQFSNTFEAKSSLWPKWLILTNRFDRGLFLRTRSYTL